MIEPRRPRRALLAVIAASVLSSLDLFVVNLAFGSIHQAFATATDQGMSWVINGYGIAFAALLVPSGRLADHFGARRAFRSGLLLFAVSSALCAAAPALEVLIAARTLQGIGAALLVPTSLGLLLSSTPPDRHRRMVGLWTATGSAAAALGPALGGLLVQVDWRWIFLINVPVALLALVFSRDLVDSPGSDARLPDLWGSVILAIGVGALVTGISYEGWASRGATVAGVLLLVVFVWRCTRVPAPALDLQLFRVTSFSVSTIGMLCFYAGFGAMLLSGPLYLTQVWHWDTVRAGVGMCAGPAAAVLSSSLFGRLRVEARFSAVLGGALFAAAACWWLVMLDGGANFFIGFMPGSIMTGTAAGIVQTAFLAGGTANLSSSVYSTAAGVLNTARQVGAALGVAVLVALGGAGQRPEEFRPVWIFIAVVAGIAAVTGFFLRDRAPVESANEPPSGRPAALPTSQA
ncbi:MFS transporter [Lentzea sp. NPDC058450]|uniref:MFS transporter n=1 Tax=Lentzea sp. NPDC058450 TaxID=3346505 RepID=UPI003655D0C0